MSGDKPTSLTRLVPASLAGLRVDRVLAELLPDVTRAELARWVDAGRVRVDGVVHLKPSGRVRAGQEIAADPAPPPPSDATPDASVVFDVMYEDDAIVVVNKPPGLVVHPARGHREGTLVNGLIARGLIALDALDAVTDEARGAATANRGGVGQRGFAGSDASAAPAGTVRASGTGRRTAEAPQSAPGTDDDAPRFRDPIALMRPGIVHRIDRGTSGVLVVAKTALARERLQALFAKHTLERVYDALAVGPLADAVTFDTAYGRHPRNRLKFTAASAPTGKRACTHVKAVERLAGGRVSRIECRLETGRTHQIRVHLAEHGAPLLGDPLYGSTSHDAAIDRIGATLGRQALHARMLGFPHPITGERMRFEAPWPDDLELAYAAISALDVSAPRSESRRSTKRRR